MKLEEAIETLCYDFLEKLMAAGKTTKAGTENSRFDVAKRSIELEFNGRVTRHSTPPTNILGEGTMAHPYHHALSSVKHWGGA